MGDFSQGLQGAGGGAALGSLFGPGGALIGGGLGLLGGLFGSDGASAYQDSLNNLATQYGSRQAPQIGASNAADSSFRQNQAGLISQLEAMARGQGPSAAALQMRESMDRAAAAQSSAAAGAGGRGVNAGAAMRNASNNTAAVQSQNARDTGLMRVQEQLGATQQLGGVIQGARGQDINLNQFNANQDQNAAMANQAAILQQLGLNQQGQLQALMGAMGAAGQGTGTALLAGGASAMPGILQFLGKGNGQGAGTPTSFWNWGSSGTQTT